MISEKDISLKDIHQILFQNLKIEISSDVKEKVKRNREKLLEKIESGEIIYGVNTGFGSLKDKAISKLELEILQENLIKSHAIGVGNFTPFDVVKLTLLYRLISLSKGYSGVRAEILEKLKEVFNKEIYVYIPLHGSVGASGDLAPLAHLALFLIGKGKVVKENKIIDFDYKEFEPIKLKEKEGLAIINGTSFSLALITYAYFNLLKIIDNLLFALALSYCGLKGNIDALSPFIHDVKKHNGQKIVAEILRKLLEDSDFVIFSKYGKDQDSYSLRCIPQILGPVIDTLTFTKDIIEKEINSVSDNPIFDDKGTPYSGGNFHAMNLALLSDYMKICCAVIANLVERLIFKFLDPSLNKGLPPFLTKNPGLNSGLMILQYTIASLTAEIRTLSNPSSIHNISTSANQEDVVSMSVPSLISLLHILEKLKIIVSSLVFTSIVAIEIRKENEERLKVCGSSILSHFYENCRRFVNVNIKDKDDVYYESLANLNEYLFSNYLELKIINDYLL